MRGFGFSLLQILITLVGIYEWVIIIRALISWVSPDPYNPIVRLLYQVTEPVLAPLRRLAPPRRLGGLDLSPLLAILLLEFVKNGILYSFGFAPRLFL